jgi:hypothetical protein
MAYIRPLEYNEAGLYIYPEYYGVNFLSFPNHSGEVIPDEMLDILLAKMKDNEIQKRRNHGNLLLESLSNNNYEDFEKNKSFYKEEDL